MKEFRDPIYGFVELFPFEARIVDTPEFQRLRGIHQLGACFLVYPSASHTRFEHSIGTLKVASLLWESVMSKEESQEIVRDTLGWGKDTLRLMGRVLRLCALLHDIGHPPFSHATEKLFPRGLTHETMGAKMLRFSKIGEEIERHLGKRVLETIVNVVSGKPSSPEENFLEEFIGGVLGADRIDYLLRDSHHLGVEYGRFDLHRFVHSLVLTKVGTSLRLSVPIEDVHSVESFILARYFMFLQVYFHKTKRILDFHLCEFVSERVVEGYLPEDPAEFMKLTDWAVMAKLWEERGSPLARRVIGRKHFRLVAETSVSPGPDEVERFARGIEALKREHIKHILDRSTDCPYDVETEVPVVVGGNVMPLSGVSEIIASLPKVNKMRVYVDPAQRDRGAKIFGDLRASP